jgi:hypothetical protein
MGVRFPLPAPTQIYDNQLLALLPAIGPRRKGAACRNVESSVRRSDLLQFLGHLATPDCECRGLVSFTTGVREVC